MSGSNKSNLQAWVDESMRSPEGSQNKHYYFLCATLIESAACDATRLAVSRIKHRGDTLHWKDLTAKERIEVSQTIANLGCQNLVVVCGPFLHQRQQERARAKCFERLTWEVNQRGVKELVIERRETSLNQRDRKLIDSLRSTGAIPKDLWIDHQMPVTEPLLWIPDVVLGVVGRPFLCDDSDPASLRGNVYIIDIGEIL